MGLLLIFKGADIMLINGERDIIEEKYISKILLNPKMLTMSQGVFKVLKRF
jgi:hypothetical protein